MARLDWEKNRHTRTPDPAEYTGPEAMSFKESISLLGVDRAQFWAFVNQGRIREIVAGQRRRVFRADDVRRVAMRRGVDPLR